jgi:hypothetical protein
LQVDFALLLWSSFSGTLLQIAIETEEKLPVDFFQVFRELFAILNNQFCSFLRPNFGELF